MGNGEQNANKNWSNVTIAISLKKHLTSFVSNITAQKIKFSSKDFISKCDQIHRKLNLEIFYLFIIIIIIIIIIVIIIIIIISLFIFEGGSEGGEGCVYKGKTSLRRFKDVG